MIKIVKDDSHLIVTRGAFENTFKSLGYEIESDKKAAKKQEDKKVVEAVIEDFPKGNKKEEKSE